MRAAVTITRLKGATMRTTTAALVCAVSLALTGCGASDEDQAKESIKASILEEGNIADTEVTEEDATCLSDGLVDEVGTDQLQEYGLLNEELEAQDDVTDVKMEESDADAVATVFVDCVDAEKMIEDQFAGNLEGLPEEQAQCVLDVIDEEKVQQIMSATFQGDTAGMQQVLQDDLEACLSPS